ncbi:MULTISPECIES: FAD-dependent oxidoreductase [Nostocales]|uniref:FAD-dependent monooxygenase n=3 Tax=Nostocales TaxID=1161 RepID=A0A0C1R334_9CYAN|nr:NAD(P)/FAD-dependent oxidoreductase [Tolypothrix bouteillei]KAF3886167.1 FAD-dependent monooxygenase [Tolypothrix bouteillei VB521301]
MTEKVVIVGAGPSGLLLSHYLLRRSDKYQIEIYERRGDPRLVSFPKYRTYSLALSPRGINALKNIAGLEEAVRAVSVEVSGTVIHQKNGKTLFKRLKTPQLTLDRTNLAIAILQKLTSSYDSSRVTINFDSKCTQVDFAAKTVTFESHSSEQPNLKYVNYDLLIGADGASSAVREELLKTEGFEYEQKYFYKDYKSIFLSPTESESKIQLQPGNLHSWRLRLNNATNLLLLSQLDGSWSGVINFPHGKNQIAELSTKQKVLQYFYENFPEIAGAIADEEAEAFVSRPISRVVSVSCNCFHHGDSVLLIGDAAHAVPPSIGQGCNSALEDVVVFDALLDEYSDNLAEALEQFTIRRRPDAWALVELSNYTMPLSGKLFVEFLLRTRFSTIMHKIFPKYFQPFLFDLITESTIPYSQILDCYRDWIDKVKKSNENFLETI